MCNGKVVPTGFFRVFPWRVYMHTALDVRPEVSNLCTFMPCGKWSPMSKPKKLPWESSPTEFVEGVPCEGEAIETLSKT